MAKQGRKRGSRNKGYFFRGGRGWCVKDARGKFVPLTDNQGERLRCEDQAEEARLAHARWLVTKGRNEATVDSVTVWDACLAYLAHAKRETATGSYKLRADTLYDFATGFPARFRGSAAQPKPSDRIHPGYGTRRVAELRPIDIDRWVQSHTRWTNARIPIKSIMVMLNYNVRAGAIPRNPLKGIRVPRPGRRATTITPEQEQAMIRVTNPQFAIAIKVLIRTGARPGKEFAALTAAHVDDLGNRMVWRFKPHESKTRKERIIRITDAEIIDIVRRQMERYPRGPIFRNTQGRPWTAKSLNQSFERVRGKLFAEGIHFDDDACVYSLRHSFAKRVLNGYWTGQPVSIQRLSQLMGNSVQVCIDHYLNWVASEDEGLWQAV